MLYIIRRPLERMGTTPIWSKSNKSKSKSKSKGFNPLPPGDPIFALNLRLTLAYGWVNLGLTLG